MPIPIDSEILLSEEQIPFLDPKNIPEHVAIMADGNRRWASQRNLPLMAGHWQGAEVLVDIVTAAARLGIKVLTVYSFSTENWGRATNEVDELMTIYRTYLLRMQERMVKEGVKLSTIGDVGRLPAEVREALAVCKEATAQGDKIELVLALNYGGRNEIMRAMRTVIDDIEQKKINKEDLSERLFSNYLDTARWKDPELLIRTSGELRLSNFLLWQISYTEVYITKIYWPDFTESDLIAAIADYQRRERRLGGK